MSISCNGAARVMEFRRESLELYQLIESLKLVLQKLRIKAEHNYITQAYIQIRFERTGKCQTIELTSRIPTIKKRRTKHL